jgi:hypothetical protein
MYCKSLYKFLIRATWFFSGERRECRLTQGTPDRKAKAPEAVPRAFAFDAYML